jgi:hypothetical protein
MAKLMVVYKVKSGDGVGLVLLRKLCCTQVLRYELAQL